MTAAGLIDECRALGIDLAAGDGGRLRYRPVDRVTPDLLARLREHKADLLLALADPCVSGPTVLPRPGWSRTAWILNLRRLAERCELVRPDRAAELRREADALERDPKLGGPWPAEYVYRPYTAQEREAFGLDNR